MKPMTKIRTIATTLLTLVAVNCGTIENIYTAKSGDYHELSPATGGIYITFKRHATDAMVAFFHVCKNDGKSDATCGRDVLRAARGLLEGKLHGTALELWNGDYSIFGYHPNIGKGFRDDEAPDFATAVYDLAKRSDECLRIHWKPSGTNWTTVDDEGVAECSWGKKLE